MFGWRSTVALELDTPISTYPRLPHHADVLFNKDYIASTGYLSLRSFHLFKFAYISVNLSTALTDKRIHHSVYHSTPRD